MIKLSFLDRDIGLCSLFAPAAAGPAVGLSAGATAGISLAAIAAEELIKHYVGQGRKAADAWVKTGTGQDAFKKNILDPAAIIAQTDPQKASDLVGQAWSKYLDAANAYATQGKNQAQVIKQNLTTPAFMQTVQSLLGRDPLGKEFTQPLGTALPGLGGGGNLASIISSIAPVIQDISHGTGDNLEIPPQPAQPPVNINPPTLPGNTQINTGTTGAAPTTDAPPVAAPRGPGTLSRIGTVLAGGAGGANNPNASLLQRLLPTALSIVPGVVGGILQSRAIGNAANQQLTANTQSLDFLKQMYAEQQANNKPWLEAGKGALTNLTTLMATGGKLYETFNTPPPTNTPFVAPTAEEAAQDPGWQFRLEQGQKAIERSQASKLGTFSGAAAKSLADYNQGMASQEYQSVYNRRFGENQQAYLDRIKQFELGQQQGKEVFNQNASIAGLGQTATQNANTEAGTFGTAAAANATNAGNVQGAATVAGGNVAANTLNGVGNTIQGQLTMQQILAQLARQQNPSGYATS